MKIKNVKVKNFRGIGSADIDIENFTTLIGPNNVGKSTILHALHILLDNKKPKIEDWPRREPSEEEMEIEVCFEEIAEWERKQPAISQLLYGDILKVKMTASWLTKDDDISYKYSVFCSKEVIEGLPKGISEAKKEAWFKPVLEALDITNSDQFKLRSEEILEYIRNNIPDRVTNEVGWHEKKFANSLQQAVPHVMYVPACFKIEDELKTTANSPFSHLFSNRLFPCVKADQSYSDYMEKAGALQDKLLGKNALAPIEGLDQALEQVSDSLNQILDFDTKIRLAITEIDIEPLFVKAATFLVSDEVETSLAYQGSGVQRALAFAMLESNAEVDSFVGEERRSIVVLYEEPELYIHPHLMRRLKRSLENKSETAEWQVICSTHSPFLIDVANKPESLKLIRRENDQKRIIYQVNPSIFEVGENYDERKMLRAALDFHPTVCESFFAKRVVLVEGDTEVAVFGMAEKLLEKFGIESSLIKDTTIVSAGGKWTIPAIARILNELSIPYKVVHDSDRKGLSADDLNNVAAIHPYRANEKIANIAGVGNVFVVDDTFEHVLWGKDEDTNIKSSDKPYNSWLRVKRYLSDEIALTAECQSTLKEILEFAFT